MCDPVITPTLIAIGAGAAAAGTAYTVYSGEKQASEQRKATKQAGANAAASLQAQEEDMNRKNAKTPNVASLISSNTGAGAAGSTLLSGAGGVNPASLTLGTNTILGR